MCLIIDGDIQTAKADIQVIKFLHQNNRSPYYAFAWKPNKLYRLHKRLKPVDAYTNIIHEGFHSFNASLVSFSCYPVANIIYIRRKHMDRLSDLFDLRSNKACEFVIPKGAKYYIGRDGDMVSTSIRSGDLSDVSALLIKDKFER
jgi:hypothetical protein